MTTLQNGIFDLPKFRIVTWNMRRASVESEAWNYIEKLAPDIALLQEVNGIPDRIKSKYNQAAAQPRTKLGAFQKFTNFVLSRFPLEAGLELTSTIDWVRNELGIFGGNILTQTGIIGGAKLASSIFIALPGQ